MSCYSVGSRGSPLARAQVAEVLEAMRYFDARTQFAVQWVETVGDRDRTTSLQTLGKSDFFTRELDEGLLAGHFDAAIHSAKDLPELPRGLEIAAITQGVDPADSLVVHREPIRRVGVTSARRIEAVRALIGDFEPVDLRGTIGERLARRDIDALVVPEAALLRLKLEIPRRRLEGETTPLQGQLAIVVRSGESEPFAALDVRRRTLFLGLDPTRYPKPVTHCPVIRIVQRAPPPDLSPYSHIIATSKQIAQFLPPGEQEIIAVGRATAASFPGRRVHVAEQETAEGVVELLKSLDLRGKRIFYPHSALARPVIVQALEALKLDFSDFVLYDTVTQKLETVPELQSFDEVFLTSPSCVRGFRENFVHVPNTIKFRSLGPITEEELHGSIPATRTALCV